MNPFEPGALTRDHLEAMTRVAGAGAALVSEAMTGMTGRRVALAGPEVHTIPIARVVELLGGSETLVVGLHMKIHGPLRGAILVALSPETAGWFFEAILRRRVAPPALSNLTRLEESALLEIGNTMAGSYLNALSDVAGERLLVSIPEMAIDMAGAVVDDILAETARGAASMLVIAMGIVADPASGRALMLHLPDPGTLPQLISAVCRAGGGRRSETAGEV